MTTTMSIIKKLSLLLLGVLLPLIGMGQVYVGVQGGYTASNAKLMNPWQATKTYYSNTADYGIVFKYFNSNPNPNFIDERIAGVQIEALMSQHGYQTYVPEHDSISIPECRTSNYIVMPALAQFRLGFKRILYLHLNAGLYVSYMLNAQHGIMSNGQYDMQPYEIKPLRDNRFDYGIMAGAGFSLDLFFGTLQAEFRYGYGLGDLYNVNYPGNYSQSPASFQSITLSYMYRFKSRSNN